MMTEAILAVDPDLRFAVEEDIEGDEERFNAVTWYNGVDENNSVIEGEPDNKPTWSQVETELTRLRAEYDAQDYARNRVQEYPKLEDQFDMLWHAIDDGTLDKTSDFYTALKTVKDKYPKESVSYTHLRAHET